MAHEKRLRLLHEQLDRDLAADRRFFQRRPERLHRIRRAFRSEVEIGLLTGSLDPASPPLAIFVVVRKLSDDVRARTSFRAPPNLDCDVDEEEASACFQALMKRRPHLQKLCEAFATQQGGAA